MTRRLAALISIPALCFVFSGAALAQTGHKPDLGKQPTLCAVGYAHLDTEWRWEYPQVINEYLRKTMEDNFTQLQKSTLLTDYKNGWDKPADNAIRLTLIRTPGVAGGYPDQATQDIGHHEFVYGIAGHAGDWRQGGTDWQGQSLNDPLAAFVATKHPGAPGKKFGLLKIDNPRIRLMALKKAEQSDELIVRMVELDGRPQPNVKITFAAPITSA